MAEIVPLMSALKETPSSTGPLEPLLTVAGAIVLGHMVCCAAALAEQVKTTARPKSTAPMRLTSFVIDIDPVFDIANAKAAPDWFFDLIVAESPLSGQTWYSAIFM